MKVAFILSAFPELSETWILNQITGLLDAGHDVHIYARANPNQDAVHQEVETYSLMERARYFDIPESMPLRAARGALLAVRNLRRRPGLVLRSISPFHYGRAAFSLSLLFAACSQFEWDYDIIQCHFGPNGL
jgi:colanic acid/amylovoran biosynthesis glycosyltransferase